MTLILHSVDPHRSKVQLLKLAEDLDFGATSGAEVDSLLRTMGLAFQVETTEGPSQSAESPIFEGIVQSWSQQNGSLTYTAEVDHTVDAIGLLDPYAAAALATYGNAAPKALSDLRLVIYELCQNVLEHGRPHHPRATLRLRLTFDARAIHGSIQDECLHFDPLSLPIREIDDQLAFRARRGYGLTLVRRALDEMTYTSLPFGNQVDFLKRIES